MANDLAKLGSKHLTAIRLTVEGACPSDIDTMLGWNQGHTAVILRTDLAKKKVEELQARMDQSTIEVMNKSREIVAKASPEIAQNLVDLALGAAKDTDKISASVQALKFAEGVGETGAQQASHISILIKNENGEVREADIFEGAAVADEDGESDSVRALEGLGESEVDDDNR